MKREVVVTGVGAVTPLGVGARTLHERWRAGVVGHRGRRGRRERVRARPTSSRSKEVAPRRPLHPARASSPATRRSPRRGWDGELPYDPDADRLRHRHRHRRHRHARGAARRRCCEQGPRKVSPLAVPLMMGNAAPAAVSMRHGLRGHVVRRRRRPARRARTRSATAARMIQYGDADAVVTGGSEAALTPLARAAFARARRAVATSGISRPFDARRDGFVMGEGAGVLVLEDGERRAERGARRSSARCAATARPSTPTT